MEQLIAVDGSFQGVGIMGALVSWRATAVSYDQLCEALAQAGLPMPEAVTEEQAVKRALDAVGDTLTRADRDANIHNTRYLTRGLGKRGAYALVRERRMADSSKIEGYDQLIESAKLHRDDKGVSLGTLDISASTVFINQVGFHFGEVQGLYQAADVGRYLVSVITGGLKGITYLDGGGEYFVPQDHASTMRTLRDALKGLGVRCNIIPVMKADDAVDAVLDALQHGVEAHIERTYDLLRERGATLGDKGRTTQTKALDEVITRVKYYETLLGKQLDALKGKCEDLQGALTATELTAFAV